MVRKNYPGRHGACRFEDLDSAMDATTTRLDDEAVLDLDTAVETWDWARTAGVSAEELRQALRASLLGPELRKAA